MAEAFEEGGELVEARAAGVHGGEQLLDFGDDAVLFGHRWEREGKGEDEITLSSCR